MLYKVSLYSVIAGVSTNPDVNVFGYKSDDTAVVESELEAFADAFIAGPMAGIRGILSIQTVFNKIQVAAFDSFGTVIERVLTAGNTGLVNQGPRERFTAWGFTYLRKYVGQRSGAKRFGAIPGDWVTGDVYSNPTVKAALDACADALAADVDAGDGNIYKPVILKRPALVGGEWLSADIAGVQYTRVTTQNSRKR